MYSQKLYSLACPEEEKQLWIIVQEDCKLMLAYKSNFPAFSNALISLWKNISYAMTKDSFHFLWQYFTSQQCTSQTVFSLPYIGKYPFRQSLWQLSIKSILIASCIHSLQVCYKVHEKCFNCSRYPFRPSLWKLSMQSILIAVRIQSVQVCDNHP